MAAEVFGAHLLESVTQPSVSYALGRLRKQLNDPLFIRARSGMVATERAQELYQVFHRAVADIDAVSGDQAFDPQTSELQFRLCLSDLGEFSFLPTILKRLRRDAPKVALDVVPTDIAKVQGWLRQGQVDAAIASVTIPGLRHRTIISGDRYVCVLPANRARAGEPGSSPSTTGRRPTLSVQEFESLRHVVIDESAGHQQVDATLDEAGLRRRTVVRLSHFSFLPNLMEDSDIAAVMPLVAAEHFERQWPVVIRELPIGPAFDVSLYWNEATSGSAAAGWFLNLLAETLAPERGQPRTPELTASADRG